MLTSHSGVFTGPTQGGNPRVARTCRSKPVWTSPTYQPERGPCYPGDTPVLRALDRESVDDEFRISGQYTLVKWNRVKSIKTIHSRSNKDIGDVIEEEWEITAKRVIAEPRSG